MDEALGPLDAKLREYMRLEIRRIQRLLDITTIHVTHDQDGALGMSDRVVVMREAKIAQVAAPRDLYAGPVSVYVADFVGRINLLHGRVVEHADDATLVELDEPTGRGNTILMKARRSPERPLGSAVRIGIRPESLRWATIGRRDPRHRWPQAASEAPLEYVSVQIGPTYRGCPAQAR